jgi:hypothetical protein
MQLAADQQPVPTGGSHFPKTVKGVRNDTKKNGFTCHLYSLSLWASATSGALERTHNHHISAAEAVPAVTPPR